MYQKKFKQLTAAILSAALIMGQAPTAYAASEEDLLSVEEVGGDLDLLVEESSDESSNSATEEGELLLEELFEDEASDGASDLDQTEETIEDELLTEESEDASTEASSEEAEDVSANDAAETELPEGIVGMPAGYKLTAEELEIKQDYTEHKEALEVFGTLTEGVDYAEDQVICFADSQEHAETIARAYSGELKSFEYGVAVINLENSEVTVAKAYSLSFVPDLNLPAVEPNYYLSFNDKLSDDDTSIDAIGDTTINEDSDVADDETEEASDESEADEEEAFDEYSVTGSDEEALYDIDFDDSEENFVGASGSSDLGKIGIKKVGAWKDIYGKKFNDTALNPKDANYQYFHDMIGSYDAWKITTGGSYSVVVGVIDTGVAIGGADLPSGRMYNAPGFPSGDDHGHGSHVAGLIAAQGNNGQGGVGVAPNAKICSLRACDSKGSFYTDKIVSALRYCAGYGSSKRNVDIVNMSLGGPSYSPMEQSAINLCYKRSVTVIVAMGNELSNAKCYPAGYNHVIAVAAVNESGKKSYFSNYGSWCSVSAPGTNIYSTYKSGFTKMDGTSMATPIVSGCAALYMSYVGHVSPEKMKSVLKKSCKGKPGSGCGSGIVNVGKMIQSASKSRTRTVKTINLNTTKTGLGFNSATGVGDSTKLSVVNVIDNKKSVITSACSYKWISSNKNAVQIVGSDTGSAVTVKAVGSGTATVTCKVTYGSKTKSKKCTVKVSSNKLVKNVKITTNATNANLNLKYGKGNALKSGQLYIGNSAYPSTITLNADQGVKAASPVWSSSSTAVATVTSNGNSATVTAKKAGKVTITCTARDGSNKKAKVTFNVKYANAKAKKVQFTKNGKGATVITAYSIAGYSNTTNFTAQGDNGAGVTWKASNKNVKLSPAQDGKTVTVTGVKEGTVKLTATAVDGSKKKLVQTIKVINPASSITIVPANKKWDYNYISYGGKITYTAALGNAYGTLSTKKVKWTYEIIGVKGSSDVKLSQECQAAIKQSKAFFTFSKGTVKCNSESKFTSNRYSFSSLTNGCDSFKIKITATTTDGSNISASRTISPRASGSIRVISTATRKDAAYLAGYSGKVYVAYVNMPYLEVVSSNPNVISAYWDYDDNYGNILVFSCHKRGTAKLTLRTTDGSSKTKTITAYSF